MSFNFLKRVFYRLLRQTVSTLMVTAGSVWFKSAPLIVITVVRPQMAMHFGKDYRENLKEAIAGRCHLSVRTPATSRMGNNSRDASNSNNNNFSKDTMYCNSKDTSESRYVSKIRDARSRVSLNKQDICVAPYQNHGT